VPGRLHEPGKVTRLFEIAQRLELRGKPVGHHTLTRRRHLTQRLAQDVLDGRVGTHDYEVALTSRTEFAGRSSAPLLSWLTLRG